MFADGGVIISETLEHLENLQNKTWELGIMGIYISEKRKKDGNLSTRIVDDGILKFLGLT